MIIDLCVFNNAQWNDDDSGTTFEKRVFRNYTTPFFGVDKYYVLLHRDDDDDIAEGFGGSSQSARDFEPLFFFRR